MRLGIMNNAWKTIFLLLISHGIIETQGFFDTFMTIVNGVQKFYLTPSTYILFDKHEFDFQKEKVLLELMKSHSKRNIMSQAITYEKLRQLATRRENTLYTLIIRDRKSLEYAINITKNTDMSIHPWLLYINKTARFNCKKPDKNFFNLRMDTRMAAMCEGNTLLNSYYGIYDQIEVIDLATWSPEKIQLKFKNQRSLVRAHLDLKRITLKVASKVNRSELFDDIHTNVAKFNFKLMDEVANLCNFKTQIVAISQETGYLHSETNKWYGMMKLMNEKVADIGLALFALSYNRMKAVDYAIPLAKGRCLLYAKLPDDTEVLWTTYFKVFREYAWIAIGVSILTFSLVVYLVKKALGSVHTHSFFEDFINIWGIFNMQSPRERSTSIPIKIVYFTALFLSLILHAIYSASITSFIAVLSPKLPFSNFDEFSRDNSYKLIVVKGSRDHSSILLNISKLSPLQGRLKENSLLPIFAYKGFQQACEKKTTFYTNEVKYASVQNFLPCKLGAVFMDRVEYMSFVMTKNSPYKKAINYNILRLMDFGLLNRLKEKYFRKNVEFSIVQPSVITLNEIWSIIIIWAIGFLITVIGLILEIIVFKLCSMRRTKHFPLHRHRDHR